MKIEGLLLVSGRETAVMLELQEQIFNEMVFFIGVPVRFSRMFRGSSAGNYRNSSAFFYPTNEFVTVISFVSQNQFSSEIEWLQQSLCHADVIAISTGE